MTYEQQKMATVGQLSFENIGLWSDLKKKSEQKLAGCRKQKHEIIKKQNVNKWKKKPGITPS